MNTRKLHRRSPAFLILLLLLGFLVAPPTLGGAEDDPAGGMGSTAESTAPPPDEVESDTVDVPDDLTWDDWVIWWLTVIGRTLP